MAIWVCPCSDQGAYEHYVNTIQTSINTSSLNGVVIKSIIDEIVNNVGIEYKLWGMTSGTRSRPNWEKMSLGDTLVFYKGGKFIGKCIVKYKMDNQDIALHHWGIDKKTGGTWNNLIFVTDFSEINIDSKYENGTIMQFQGTARCKKTLKRVTELLNLPSQQSTPITAPMPPSADKNICDVLEKVLKKHKQVILTGAPGTGKTYSAKEYVKMKTSDNKDLYDFVQFHPSYDYSDFVEGLRPVVIDGASNPEPTFVRMDGIFKAFCRKIVENNYKEITSNNPGYGEDKSPKKLYKEHEDECITPYYFIIDEINRADLSKVFGELMYGLEESYRGIEHSVMTQYRNLPTYYINSTGKAETLKLDCFKEGFFIPKNLYIIGTMNDIDRSVETFDFALRRRFEWIEIKTEEIMEDALKGIFQNTANYSAAKVKELANRVNDMNKVISETGVYYGLSDAYNIGPAYFSSADLDDPKGIQTVFDKNIVSLLHEYLRGRDQDVVDGFIKQCAEALDVKYEMEA